ncbi:MAG: DUF3300 domain-containing protein [Shewanella sp.]
MNRTPTWRWLVLSAALIALPFSMPIKAAPTLVSQGVSQVLSPAELEQMLAPIALYPDSLLSHILISATYPLEVVQAQRWLADRSQLSVEQVMAQAQNKGWDPSVKALLAFPTVLQKMAEDLEWTQKLGEAFLADEAQVMDGIQSLRQQADNANSLRDMDNMTISRSNNQIIIEPARREIVYVPYYDPRIVYGTWRWGPAYPPVYWHYSDYAYRPGHSHFYWTPGIQISFNFFFSAFHWHNHRVVVIDHHHSHHYRPREKYSVSHGAQPWKHKVEHRRGVGYHNPAVKQRYYAVSQGRDAASLSSGSSSGLSSGSSSGLSSGSSASRPQFTSQYASPRPSMNPSDMKDRKPHSNRPEPNEHNQAMKDKSINNQDFKDRAVQDREVNDRAVKDRAVKDREMKDRSAANKPQATRESLRAPSYQQTQAQLAERRAASKPASPTYKEHHDPDNRYGHASSQFTSKPLKSDSSREVNTRELTRQQKRDQTRESPRSQAPRYETPRHQPARQEPARVEQPRPAAPRPREETRIRQEPRANQHIARTSEPRARQPSQERRQRE